jgi:hypothetical protein
MKRYQRRKEGKEEKVYTNERRKEGSRG